jgi:hypothetical protein
MPIAAADDGRIAGGAEAEAPQTLGQHSCGGRRAAGPAGPAGPAEPAGPGGHGPRLQRVWLRDGSAAIPSQARNRLPVFDR